MSEFKMPSLGAEMEAGRLVEWRVKPGDTVKRGDIVALVDTDKAAVEVEIWENGVVGELLVQPGQRVPVGTVLATIKSEGESIPASAAAAVPERKLGGMPAGLAPAKIEVRLTAEAQRVSPAARKRARELNVDLAKIRGTGPDGAITSGDVERSTGTATAEPMPPVSAHATEEDRKKAMRATIVAAMTRSKREIPHYYLSTQIDMNRSLEWLAAENVKRPVTERILYPALLLKAVAKALERVPELSGFWKDGQYVPNEAIHIGVAISLRGGGLIAPALHDVGKKTLSEVMQGLSDLVARTRAGSLKSSELTDATITVTNLGEQGVEEVLGVIYPPQVALVGFGKIIQMPWVTEGEIAARPVIRASLSADHRVSDGHRGAVFLSVLERLLQEPKALC